MKTMTDTNPNCDGLACRNTQPVFVVVAKYEYEGDEVKGVFLDEERARAARTALQLSSWQEFGAQYRVERWTDGATSGVEI